ncbi:GTP pyrophosphokinase [Catenisphaera adipataccumulans]|jgi:putative GTP pyrophosphokinase|uniref:Putative GTP pyrophosphokinase n=1 Tax=Catenisphaera adipataccumulans TaxID=700500 RepID=A0A7W8CYC8_9FIRM|nr:GTP pyrophosphokinase family protein [Catenisphaera adipataccumulans]MBB5183868.1 putative GTP pyrophosphokinase [Catenisphaera adipataccumulans]
MDQYDQIADQLQSLPYRQLMTYYRCALREVETKFRVLDDQFSLFYDRNPIESIECRIKSQSSIYHKLKKRNLPFTLESLENNIFDIAGIRVISSFSDDIYMLAGTLLKQDDIRLVERKDYIKNPKPNGYRSLHLIVEVPIFLANEKKWMKVEVQFRTIAMDLWASLEHKLRYKKDLPQSRLDEISQDLLDCADLCAQLDEKMGKLKRTENQPVIE